jgi:group I intron endonuclease
VVQGRARTQDRLVEALRDFPAMAKRMGILYLIRFKNGKGYVGQTVQKLSQRIKDHLRSSSGCKALKAALRKYGSDAWEVTILAIVSEDELNAEECRLISELGTLAPSGYNILPGGEQMRDQTSQEAMRQARIASAAFQAARREVQARASTTLKRRKTTAAKRDARIADMDVIAADRAHYDAWRHAYRHARLAAEKLPEGSLRNPFAEVAALYGAGPPTRNPDAIASLKAKESVRISNQRRDHAKRKRAERVASMGLEEAVAFMKQARCNALYVAKTRTPDKLPDVQALWAKEWRSLRLGSVHKALGHHLRAHKCNDRGVSQGHTHRSRGPVPCV